MSKTKKGRKQNSINIPKGSRSKTPRCKVNKIRKEIAIKTVKKTGLSDTKIECFLSNSSHFLGCFAQDELRNITIKSLPIFLIVNLDHSYSEGTHWIALRIDETSLEIFDSLGFNFLRWPNIPHFLLDFLNKYSKNRKILISNELQPYNSTLCGFYCIFFVLYRATNTFSSCNNIFSNQLYKNDKILVNFFNKL